MAIKPILFNTEMVRAILEGRKSCTRRIVKPQQFIGMLPDKCKNGAPEEFLKEKKLMFKPYCDMTDIELINTAYKDPYQPGDILYVRETWCKYDDDHIIDGRKYAYKADASPISEEARKKFEYRWRPSIHMPKEAARIWLKVNDIRVERLQEITEVQAQAEGCNSGLLTGACTARGQFEDLWNTTIKKSDLDRYGWDANPYVFVIEFERCEKSKEVNDND